MLTTDATKRYRTLAGVLLVALVIPPFVRAQEQGISPSEFKFSAVDDKLLGEATEYNRQLEKKGLVFHDPVVESYVQEIGRKLVANQPPMEKVEFRFRVLRDPMVNAFASPDGSIYVTTGLLARLEDEAQLASVLGHEVTHVVKRHMYLENRSMRKKALAINILDAVAACAPGGSTFGEAVIIGANLSAMIVNASIYGYSQNKEREADRFGFELMTQSSYDPAAMPRTFELLDERLEFEPVEGFYRTHPKLEERRKTALEWVAAATPKDARVGTESDYLAHVAPVVCANIESDLNSRRARTALARAERLAKWKPDEPKYQVLVADAYRSLGAKPVEPTLEEQGRHGQAEHRKQYFQMTEAEEQRQLLTKPDGSATRDRNLHDAEALYLGAIQLNPKYPDPHRGLGFLYEQEMKPTEAAREYKTYLDLTGGTSLDRLRIERRLADMERAMAK